MHLTQTGDLGHGGRIVEDGAVALSVHPVDEVGEQVDEERAVRGCNLAEVIASASEGELG